MHDSRNNPDIKVIGTAGNADNNACSCDSSVNSWPQTATITDTTTLNSAWNFGGTNELKVEFSGHANYYVSWYEANISYETNVHAVAKPESQTISVDGTANFNASESYVDNGSIVSYGWDFGDGTNGSGITTSHTYTVENTYTVKLTVTGDTGRKGTDFATVYVQGSPPVVDANGPYSGMQYDVITFDGSGSSDDVGIVKYEWDFGDGKTGTGVNAKHAYNSMGTYTVTLTVYDGANQTDTDTSTVTVTYSPCNAGSANVLVTNPGGTGGGAYPYSFTTQNETTVTYTTINAALLANYDTFVMWRTCETYMTAWTAQQKTDIVNWVYNGGKLVIWDTECTDNPSYTWLPYPITTNNPGAMGASGWHLTIVENNTLSHTDTTSPYYINTAIISSSTDAVGDANVLTTYTADWCVDMEAENYNQVTGPVHVYSRYGSGLITYSGLDADYMGGSSADAMNLTQILVNELNQRWGQAQCGLPCGNVTPLAPGVLNVTKTADKTIYNVGDNVTFTITVSNTGNSTTYSVSLTDYLPSELASSGPLSWNLGNMNSGDSVTKTVNATVVSCGTGTVQNIAGASGTDGSGKTIASNGKVTITIVCNQPPIADAGPNQTVEQTSHAGAYVTLNGSGSYDPDGDNLTYNWTWTGGSVSGVTPTVTFPLGITTVTLTVYDWQFYDNDTVNITVQDTTPPKITTIDKPIELWPANHKYNTIKISDCVIAVTDICDAGVGVEDVVITSVSSDEPEDVKGEGDGNTLNDIVIVDPQTVNLRAERQGDGNGRIYTLNFNVTDASGNTATGKCKVSVRHDQKPGHESVDDGPIYVVQV
ncbi:MAG: hypothetical protein CVT89_00445 [Candidatus Altiarchaeales archaeon HGW-Altiarchaeales-2]|nr:MAG: hypothetical protein CVT89_00445 [Candidatus Altiarchaeales archaeon HGW-Altiarchaeales-2]